MSALEYSSAMAIGARSPDQSSWSTLDITKLCEHAAFNICPTAFLIAACPFHLIHYNRKPRIRALSGVLWSKLALVSILFCIELLRAAVCRHNAEVADKALIASTSLACIASACIGCMLFLEHHHATQASVLISLYLTTAICVDFTRACVYIARPGFNLLGALSAVTTAFKLSLVIQQEVPKQLDPPPKAGKALNPERTAGFWNRTLGIWLNSTILFGFRNAIRLSDLPSVEDEFLAANLDAKFKETLATGGNNHELSLMEACFWTLRWPLFLTAVPRFCQTLFTFSLARVIELVLQYIKDKDAPSYVYTALVALIGFVYAGIAVSRASAIHQTSRLTTSLRGILLAGIFEKNLKLPYLIAKQNTALTLTSNDVDGTLAGVELVNDWWISAVEVLLALYNLSGTLELGVLLVMVPLVAILYLSWQLARKRRAAVEHWSEGIQNRLSRMAITLSQMKAIKMIGLESVVMKYIQRLRFEEIERSEGIRNTVVQRFTMVPLTSIFSYAMAAAAMVFVKKHDASLDTLTTFRVLASMALLTEPMIVVLQSSYSLGTMAACFTRIEQFLRLEERQDRREVRDFNPRFETYLNQALQQHDESGQAFPEAESEAITSRYVAFLNVSIPSNSIKGMSVLRNLQFSVHSESLLMIIGPTASGKSALLKAIIGETLLSRGAIHVSENEIAFCDQRPWIPNLTIQEIIVGEGTSDAEWYKQVIHSCVLNHDLEKLARGDQTLAGINGSALSGGQKQRIATARAVYAKRKLLVLDDILSALDRRTANLVVTRLLGPRGILKKNGMTAILATNSVEYLNFADTVLVLDKQGNLTIGDPTDPSQYEIPTSPSQEVDNREEVPENNDLDTFDPLAKERKFAVQDAALPPESIQSSFQYYKMFFRAAPKAALRTWLACLAFAAFSERAPDIYIMRCAQLAPSMSYWLLLLLAFGVLAAFVDRKAASVYMMVIVPLIANDLHELFLETLMQATVPFLTSVNSGILLNRFSQDMTLISFELPIAINRFLYMCVLVTTDTIVITRGAPHARYMFPVIMASLWYLQHFYLRTSRQFYLIDLEARSPLLTKLTETITGLEHIRSFGWQTKVRDKSFALINQSQKSHYYQSLIQRWLFLILDIKVGIIAMILVAIGAKSDDSFTDKDLALALLCTISYSLGMRNLIRDWAKADNGMRAVVRLATFVKQTPREQDSPDAQLLPEDDERRGDIELCNVAARYTTAGKPRMAIEDVNLKILDGQRVGIIGRTGSGKSSLILTFLNALKHVGSVMVDSVDITRIPRAQLRNMITTIPQETLDLPGTVRQNLLPRDILVEDKDEEQTFDEGAMVTILQSLDLYDYIVARGGLDQPIDSMEFSAGQKQLIGIARGILHHRDNSTRIVLMDEPTSSIDAETNSRIQKAINESFENCTKVIISHRKNEYRDCDVLLEMVDGRIINHVETGRWRSEAEVAQRLEERIMKRRWG